MTKHLAPSQIRRFRQRNAERRATKTRSFTRSCHKRRFPTEIDAKIALASAQRLRHGSARPKDECRYYRCPHCAGFHLTSSSSRSRTPPARQVPLIKEQLDQEHRNLRTLKGTQVFIEAIADGWTYAIPEFDVRGTSDSREEAKQSALAIVGIVAPRAKASLRYADEGFDIEEFYAHQVAGPQTEVTTCKNSYMEPLLRRVRSYLFRQGLRFRKYDDRYPGPPDIVLPRLRTMVFMEPCLWHDSPECLRKAMPPEHRRVWIAGHAEERALELEKRRQLEDQGWRVIVHWECRYCDNRKRDKRLRSLYHAIMGEA